MNQAQSPPDMLLQRFRDTRAASLANCEPLQLEDYALQAEPFTSPPKWHLAHTTWFFETFLLKPYLAGYTPREPLYEMLFNSYYNGVGEQFPRPQRGLLSRPSLEEVLSYRESVDRAMESLLADTTHSERGEILSRLRLGIEHECQHQELFFTDIKYSLSVNPLHPAYREAGNTGKQNAPPMQWQDFAGGEGRVGYSGGGFCFDNELPRHRSFLEPFQLASKLVSNGDYAAFIADGGYDRPDLWLADGWDAVQRGNWRAPLYWNDAHGAPMEFTLFGLRPIDADAPVCHLSGYEAEAYARWADARLPTEQEWEVAASQQSDPAISDTAPTLHPQPAHSAHPDNGPLLQLYEACWQWTRSAYTPYPGFNPSPGAIGEYNGKFMSNQWVLRGGSCVSSPGHLRPSYRNFFYPVDRWQFTGLRLARDLR